VTSARRGRPSLKALLSVSEAAALLGVHPSTLYRAINRGDAPVNVVPVGKRYRVPRVSVERLLGSEVADPTEGFDLDRNTYKCPSCGESLPVGATFARRARCSAARGSAHTDH